MKYLSTLQSRLRLAVIVIGLLALIIFLLQNTDSIQVKFLFFEGGIPTGVLILVTALAGFAVGYYVAFSDYRGRRKRQIAREKEKEKARQDQSGEKA